MVTHVLEVPVMVFGKNFLAMEVSLESFTTCTPYAYTTKYYENMRIIDSTGSMLRLISARRIGYQKLFSMHTFFLNPLLRVEFEFEPYANLTLDEAKVEIVKHLEPGLADIGYEPADLHQRVNQSKSFRELLLNAKPFL